MWFNKQDSDEFYPPKDEYQRKYRQAFEGVVDKYLIHHCDDENAKILIYIDPENDIDWIMMKAYFRRINDNSCFVSNSRLL